MPLQDADPTPSLGRLGFRGCVQQMKELSKPEFTELLESAEDEQLEFMAEAIVSTQKKRHGWRRWIQPDRIWLVLLTALWIYPWVVGVSTDGDLALMEPHLDLVFNLVGVDPEPFLAGIEDTEPEILANEGCCVLSTAVFRTVYRRGNLLRMGSSPMVLLDSEDVFSAVPNHNPCPGAVEVNNTGLGK